MAKPFSIQSPEDVAKEYAGNKQQIAQAMQMGIVDPTAGVLAGMFIDRMRSAQVMEGANPPTVAQQVMGGAPPAAPTPPLPVGGLGGTPAGAPPMAPQMGAPPEMGMAPPMGMADGGIASLPVPDAMFDEPTNGGYAGGGIVAFAEGGISDLYDDVEYWESGGKQGAVSPKGARGVMQLMPDTMRDPGFGVRPMQADTEEENRRVGQEYLDAMYRRYGDKKVALAAYNWGPGKVDKWLASGADPKKLPAETRKYIANIMGGKSTGEMPERNVETAEGRRRLSDDQLALAQERFSALPESGLGELEAYYRGELDPKAQREERKQDMWMALAQLGANMAASNSPFFLQAAGEAIASALPGVAASKKERKEAERDARKGLREVLGLARDEQKEVIQYAQEREIAELRSEESQAEREARINEAAAERMFRSEQNDLDRKLQDSLAKLRVNPSDMESAMFILQNGTAEQKAALEEYFKLKGSSGSGMADTLRTQEAGGGGGGATAPVVLDPM